MLLIGAGIVAAGAALLWSHTVLLIGAGIVATGFAVVWFAWVPYSKHRWNKAVQEFCVKHAADEGEDTSAPKDILFVVCPVSGGGNALKLYETCVKEFKKTGRKLEIFITKSKDDIRLLSTKKDLSPYKVIAVLGGDSSITEMVQEPMLQHGHKWPYAPILHLPGGTDNVICVENFGAKTSVTDIVRKGLEKVKHASVIQLSAPGATTRYATHICFTGVQLDVIDELEQHRGDLYPAFGNLTVIALAIKSAFTSSKDIDFALFTAVNSDVAGLGADLGFGVNRFDDQMIVVDSDKHPSATGFLKTIGNILSGELAKQWKEKELPNDIKVFKTNNFALEKKGHHFMLYSDGTSATCFESDDRVDLRVVPSAIPYYVLS